MKRIFIILGIFVLAACGGNKGDKKAQLEKLKGEQEKISAQIKELETELAGAASDSLKKEKIVAVTEVKTQSFKHFIDVQGKIDSDENISVSAKTPGTVAKVFVKAGDVVKSGQLLASLDNGVMVQGIEELKSSLAFATNVYQKQKNLWDQKIGSEIQFLTAKNNKESLERKLATMNEQNDMANIKSPINGTVDEVMIKIGQTVAPGVPAVRVVNIAELKAKADIAEAYASKIKSGNEVIVHLPDGGKDINGKVSFAGRAINPLTRTFNVEVELPTDGDLHPNMVAVLKVVDYKNDASVVVPVNAVQNSEEGQYVLLAITENGKKVAKRQAVKIGSIYGGVAEVKSGLNKGDKVITTGYQDLNSGDLIKF